MRVSDGTMARQLETKIEGKCSLMESVQFAIQIFLGLRSLAGFRSSIFLLLYPLLEAAFKDPPLAADLERGNLTILNHSVQGSFGNF